MEPRRFPVQRQPPNLRFKPKLRTDISKPVQRNPSMMDNIICHQCGMRGHMAKDCQKPKIVCFGCGQAGHMKPDCPNKQNHQVGRGTVGEGNPNRGGFKPRNGGFG